MADQVDVTIDGVRYRAQLVSGTSELQVGGAAVDDENPLPIIMSGEVSTVNSSQTALDNLGSFAGDWEVNNHEHVGVNVVADQNGFLTIQFGIVDDGAPITDGVVANEYVNALPVNATEAIYAGVPYFRALVKMAGRACRIIYNNSTTPQTTFRLLTTYGNNLFPPSSSSDNELLTTVTERERNVFTAYSPGAITSDGTTWACLVDLSDTDNWRHDRTGRIDISIINLSIDKSTNCTGSVSIGVITRVDATNGDVTFFAGASFTNSSDNRIVVERNYAPSQLKCGVSGGVTTRIATSAKTANDTGIQTDVPLASFLGAGTVTPAVGDIVIRFVKTAGTTMSPACQLFYHGERSA